MNPQYQAFCLRCMGGGKFLGRPGSKRDAEREATGHGNAYGHDVTIIDQARKANAGQGYGFNFHGSFAKKADAMAKEAATPGSFIRTTRPPRGGEGLRYTVMSPRAEGNPTERPLPEMPAIPQTGQYPAVQTDDGSIYVDRSGGSGSTHIKFIQRMKIPPERIISGGWVHNGVYEGTERSDSVRYAERVRAQLRVKERRAEGNPFSGGYTGRSYEGYRPAGARKQFGAEIRSQTVMYYNYGDASTGEEVRVVHHTRSGKVEIRLDTAGQKRGKTLKFASTGAAQNWLDKKGIRHTFNEAYPNPRKKGPSGQTLSSKAERARALKALSQSVCTLRTSHQLAGAIRTYHKKVGNPDKEIKVGSFVTLHIASLRGPMKVAGIVKRILPQGIEVKTQQHGYHIVPATELRVVNPRAKGPSGQTLSSKAERARALKALSQSVCTLRTSHQLAGAIRTYHKKVGNPPLLDVIRPGARVTIVNRFGQQSTGRAVMRGPAGWVLNMGGRYGTPAIANDENIVRVKLAKVTGPSLGYDQLLARRNPGLFKRFTDYYAKETKRAKKEAEGYWAGRGKGKTPAPRASRPAARPRAAAKAKPSRELIDAIQAQGYSAAQARKLAAQARGATFDEQFRSVFSRSNPDITRAEAIKRLTKRWNEQALLYPMMRNEVPLKKYISANLPHVMRRKGADPLAAYANPRRDLRSISFSVRTHYTSGAGENTIMERYKISRKQFDDIMRGKYIKGSGEREHKSVMNPDQISQAQRAYKGIPVFLVQYKILNKYYSVGFSTRQAAEKAVAKLAAAGRQAAIVESIEKQRANPATDNRQLATAKRSFARFHGEPAKRVSKVAKSPFMAPDDYWKCGDAMELFTLSDDGEYVGRIAFAERTPAVGSNPAGSQLYFIAGDQNIDASLPAFARRSGKDLVDLGRCYHIRYLTRKSMDKFQTVLYCHDFGKETGRTQTHGTPDPHASYSEGELPRLIYDCIRKKLALAGGQYKVKPEGIVG